MLLPRCFASTHARSKQVTTEACSHELHVRCTRPQATPRKTCVTTHSSSAGVADAEVEQSKKLRTFTPGNWPRVEAGSRQCPVVLLPGFGNNSADYLAPFGEEDASIAAALRRRGFSVYVVPVERKDWFKVARALLTWEFYKTQCTTDPGYTWYLDRIKETVDAARLDSGADQVDLLGHSAGGWLARAYLADEKYFEGADCTTRGHHSAVRSLVSLGTPHSPPPADKVKDMTGGALTWVNTTWPGSYHDTVSYVSVAGRTVTGDKTATRGTLFSYAHNSYLQVCGEGQGVEGDAVVPVQSAVLEV